MRKYFKNLLARKTITAVGASLLIWGGLLTFMASDPLPETLNPGVFETIDLAVPMMNPPKDGEEQRRRYLMLPAG